MRALKLREHDAAARLMDSHFATGAGGALAHDLAALCELHVGNYTKALSHAMQATALDPGRARGWARLGAAQLCMRHARAAAAAYERGLALDPDSGEMRAGLDLARAAEAERGARRAAEHHS